MPAALTAADLAAHTPLMQQYLGVCTNRREIYAQRQRQQRDARWCVQHVTGIPGSFRRCLTGFLHQQTEGMGICDLPPEIRLAFGQDRCLCQAFFSIHL